MKNEIKFIVMDNGAINAVMDLEKINQIDAINLIHSLNRVIIHLFEEYLIGLEIEKPKGFYKI